MPDDFVKVPRETFRGQCGSLWYATETGLDPTWLLAAWKWLHRQGCWMGFTENGEFVFVDHRGQRLSVAQPIEELAIVLAWLALHETPTTGREG